MIVYCFDTSSFLEGAADRPYAFTSFPTLWDRLAGLAQKRRLISPDEVLRDLEKKDDDVHDWVKALKADVFRPAEKIQSALRVVMKEFPTLAEEKRGRSISDPWVIALARITTGAIVVSEEDLSTNPNRVKIPNVCRSYNIECIRLREVVRRERWSF